MSKLPESDFPTLRDFRDRLSELVDKGLGELAAQILVVPDSTMQAIASHIDPTRKQGAAPALMIDLDQGNEGRQMPVSLISTDRMSGGVGMPSRRIQ